MSWRTQAISIYVIALTSFYTIVLAHTPITVHAIAPHDDGLFMRLGWYLSQGNWLGPFNQFTLMKGPGYPAFLALTHWLGISVSLAHALFHCAAITFFVVVAHRFVSSLWLSGLLLALLLWHPISFTAYFLRVFREDIYHGQVLILLAFLLCALYAARRREDRYLYAGLGGLAFGWFWLTREEGLWIVPALGLLLLATWMPAYRNGRARDLALTVAVFLAVFAATQMGFRVINWINYGKFVGVDFKETNFERALGALSSVRSGGVKPFIPVTRAAREQIYAVSPAFASLQAYLDGPAAAGWVRYTCDLLPDSCGEIAGGWFVWALRDAASRAGHYASPKSASIFFGQLANEISVACASKVLECSPQFISEMPPVSWRQIAELLPSSMIKAYDLLAMADPPWQPSPSSGTPEQLDASLRFLNYPVHMGTIPASKGSAPYLLSGWYYKAGREWMSVDIRASDGSRVAFRFDRKTSPDLQQAFKDPEALNQRFTISTNCMDSCVVEFQTSERERIEKSLAELRRAPITFKVGEGRVYIDTAEVDVGIIISNIVRKTVATYYKYIYGPVVMAGIIAFVAATSLRPRKSTSNVCWLLALTSWSLVILRVGLLILIEVTSFPALAPNYLTPAYFFLACGAVFSIAAFLQVFNDSWAGWLHNTKAEVGSLQNRSLSSARCKVA